jgi:hypothetical protein
MRIRAASSSIWLKASVNGLISPCKLNLTPMKQRNFSGLGVFGMGSIHRATVAVLILGARG